MVGCQGRIIIVSAVSITCSLSHKECYCLYCPLAIFCASTHFLGGKRYESWMFWVCDGLQDFTCHQLYRACARFGGLFPPILYRGRRGKGGGLKRGIRYTTTRESVLEEYDFANTQRMSKAQLPTS